MPQPHPHPAHPATELIHTACHFHFHFLLLPMTDADTPFRPGVELAHWVTSEQLPILRIATLLPSWKDAVRLAASGPRLWPHVTLLVALAPPDVGAAQDPATPERLRIPLLTGLTAADARAFHNGALRRACRYGHLAVARWLVATFALTAADARAVDNAALRSACYNDHLAVAQWLTTTFGLTAADARAYDNHALRGACANGHLAVARWLQEEFGITRVGINK